MSNNQKISQFNALTTLSDSALVTIVSGGQNFNITFGDLKNVLGVTGTVESIGATLGTPILNSPSPNEYQIRSLESNKGIVASVSANNGISLGCNFTQSNVGTKLINDLNANQYVLKTLRAGSGVNLNSTPEGITIDFTPAGSATKTVTVSDVSDFPTPVAGVITLDPDTDYLITEDITTPDRFIVSRPNTFRAASSQMVTVTYTGSGTMFTGVNPSFKIVNITVDCPNGTLFSTTAPTLPGIVQMVESNVASCQSLGTIDGNFITRFTNVAFENLIAGGLTFSGANQILVVDVGVVFLGGGSLIDLGTATFQSISITGGVIPSSAPGTYFLSGLANSGNIVAGGLGTVINNKGFGSGTPLNNISTDDARWNFLGNNNIPDTRPDALLYLSATATTTIASIGVPVLMNGVWTESRTSQMTTTAAGRASYDGEKNATLPITAKISAEPVSGNGVQIGVYLAKNGVVINETEAYGTADAGKPTSITVIWQDSFANGDYYEVFVENNTNTTDISVTTAQLRVN